MAASDPTPYVATPTGVLQGVAAFSWDGSAWTPSGRAGPGVATPTGVLQGIAPFSWDGAGWQPVGRAGPGVATPTGTLDGVAVYTWSGSAWTPAYGGPGCRTPSGVLRGVAAFSWDGAAWQPASQARPSVPTPYGVLAGVAMFNWSGTTWAAGAAVPSGATLDLSFLSGALDPRIAFTRASTATYFDSSGVLQTAAINAPRFDYDPATRAARGLLIEEARTNELLSSAALGTRSVTVTAQVYTLSFYGTGTLTLSNASTAGPLTGTGATNRVALTFTPAAGTLTCTASGSVLNAQLEAGAFATSYIPTTVAGVTRAADVASMPGGAWYNATQGSLAYEYIMEGTPPSFGAPVALVGADPVNDYIAIDQFNAGGSATAPTFARHSISLGGAITGYCVFSATPLPAGIVQKGAAGWTQGIGMLGTHNGVSATPFFGNAPTLPVITGLRLSGIVAGQPAPSTWARRVRYWPRVLSDTEMQSVTT